MNKLIILLVTSLLLPFCTKAQLGKLMAKYHGKECVTVTQLDKNLYGLYKKKNISPEAENLLKQLKEVNILTLDLNHCNENVAEEIDAKFKSVLDNPDKYKLIKSHSENSGKQWIYAHSDQDKVSDLVVWNQTPQRMDIIELKGDIDTENIALLSKALNIKGLNSLSSLNSENENYNNYLRSFDYDNMADMSRQMQEIAQRMRENFREMFGDQEEDRFFSPFDYFRFDGRDSLFRFSDVDSLFGSMGMRFNRMSDIFDRLNPLPNGIDIRGNSVQITEENGKTKIKINTQNSDMIYIVDGVKFEGEEVSMPEKIRDVRIVGDTKNPRKSYLIVISNSQLGQFVSYKNHTLTFQYGDQEYKYNLEKASQPLLVINGEVTNDFTDIHPNEIQQIRPLTPMEKEIGEYGSAEVFILTQE
ncbi:DUF4252 domain-containing protein [Odoribacter laneus]|uniref:DUF4252 domain-containing protein n=1 Tax=Odoribacter laneus TaxID=626933 RepID=UPI003AB2F405